MSGGTGSAPSTNASASPAILKAVQPLGVNPEQQARYHRPSDLWLVPLSIVGSGFLSALLVVLLVSFDTRFHLWRAEKLHGVAIAEIEATRHKWAETLQALEAKSDTVNRWRRFMSKSVGGSR